MMPQSKVIHQRVSTIKKISKKIQILRMMIIYLMNTDITTSVIKEFTQPLNTNRV